MGFERFAEVKGTATLLSLPVVRRMKREISIWLSFWGVQFVRDPLSSPPVVILSMDLNRVFIYCLTGCEPTLPNRWTVIDGSIAAIAMLNRTRTYFWLLFIMIAGTLLVHSRRYGRDAAFLVSSSLVARR